MANQITRAGLNVAHQLVDFVETRVLPGTGIAADAFWSGMADIYTQFAPRNRALLVRRDAMQALQES